MRLGRGPDTGFVLFALRCLNDNHTDNDNVETQATRMVANISDAMLRWIAVNEATSKRRGWRGGASLKPRRLLAVRSNLCSNLLIRPV